MSVKLDAEALRKARAVCPKCQRKGVGFAMHAHALGWKDTNRASCRYCHARFVLTQRQE